MDKWGREGKRNTYTLSWQTQKRERDIDTRINGENTHTYSYKKKKVGPYFSFMREREKIYKGLLISTCVLGLAFLVLQYQGWLALFNIGVEFNGNPSGSFVYVISGLHAAHILAGIGVLFVALVHAFSLNNGITKIRKRRLELSLIFWHFLGFLWIYLYLFFSLQQA